MWVPGLLVRFPLALTRRQTAESTTASAMARMSLITIAVIVVT